MLDLFEKLAAKEPKDKGLDLQLWQKWNDGGRKPEDLKPLVSQFRGMIRNHANQFIGNVELPPAAINAEFKRHFVKALTTYDPTKGAQLGTWVWKGLSKAKSFVAQHQNVVRISEKRIFNIGEFNNARSQLNAQFGRDPTTHELADHLGWHQDEVVRLQKQQRADLIGSEMAVDPIEFLPSKEHEAAAFLPYDLDSNELFVYEHAIGANGKPKLTGNEIAKRMGVSPATVSRIKTGIAHKAKKLMED